MNTYAIDTFIVFEFVNSFANCIIVVDFYFFFWSFHYYELFCVDS